LDGFVTNPTTGVDAFMALDVSAGKLFTPGSALGYSETEFIKLSRAVMEQTSQRALDDLARIKTLAREVKTRGDAARAQGDNSAADRYTAQLQKLGQRLGGPDQLKITQLVGQAIVKLAKQ
jgi:CRP-like cAMP-binding protein